MRSKQIINGWINTLKSTLNVLDEATRKEAEKRSNECFSCEKFVRFVKLPVVNTPLGHQCSECKCIYPALVLAKDKKCPLGKW